MRNAISLIEQCLAYQDTVLDLGNCGLRDKDLAPGSLIGSSLGKCTHLTKLILSNERFHWNLDETTVLITNGEYVYKSRPEFWKQGQSVPRKTVPASYFSIPDYRPLIQTAEDGKDDNILNTIPEVVRELVLLEELVCGGSRKQRWKITFIEPVHRLKNLKTLVLSNNSIEAIDCLVCSTSLKKLDVSNNKIKFLLRIQTLGKLQALDLSYNELSNVEGLENFPLLEWLNLSSNKLVSMYQLAELPLLQFLDLSDNIIVTFKPFKKDSLLRVLNLSDNLFDHLDNLEELPKLRYLYARRNRIKNISWIAGLKQMQLLDLSNNIIECLPDGLNSLEELLVLDISNNGLHALNNIGRLQKLKILNAANNRIKKIKIDAVIESLEDLILNHNRLPNLSVLPWLPRLKKLFVSDNDLEEVMGVGTSFLTTVVLFNNKISNLLFIRGCENLTYLDVSHNQVAELENGFYYPNLKSLFADTNKIKGELSLKNYPALINVDLSFNFIQEITDTENLNGLETIYLHYNLLEEIGEWNNMPVLNRIGLQNNKIKFLPDSLLKLPELHEINFSQNEISIAPDFTIFPQLRRINLSGNNITEIKGSSTLFSSLEIDLSRNKIASLPDIYSLLKFKVIDFSYNPITVVNKFIKVLKEDDELEMTRGRDGSLKINWRGNKLLLNGPYFDIPGSVNSEDSLSIKNWFIARDEGGFINLEVKCILFGNGETGKTALSNYLRTGKFYPVNNRTHGILIDSWRVKRNTWTPQFLKSVSAAIEASDAILDTVKVSDHFTFNIWDFGGQEFYHATHRLFMSTDVLYLILWEEDSDFQDDEKGGFPKEYWVNNIQHYAPGSSILLVQNRADKVFYVEADNCYKISTYYKHNSESIARFHLDMQLLKEGIFTRVSTLPHFAMYTPEVYQRIKDHLEKIKEPYISFVAYKAICQEKDNTNTRIMADESQCESLLKYLDNIGSVVCFFYRGRMKDELLKDYVFTDPKWLTSVIYEILELGTSEFDITHVDKVVAPYRLPPELWIRVMQSFGLIFEVKSKVGIRFIVPQYLPWECPNRSALDLVLAHKNILHSFTVSYPRFMLVSNFLRLVSNYGSEHFEYLYWKKGLVFFKNGKTVFVECVNKVEERKIKVSVQDQDQEVAVDVFNSILDIDLSEDLEISIDESNYVKYSLLRRKMTGSNMEIDATNGETLLTKNFNYLFKMQNTVNKERIVRVFVSYSSKDKDLQELIVQGLKDHLVTRAGYNFQIWSDPVIDMGADREGEIMENIRTADVLILLVSASFAASSYIKKEESDKFQERMKNGDFLLLPVLGRSFDFMSYKELAAFQFFKAYYREYGFTSPVI